MALVLERQVHFSSPPFSGWTGEAPPLTNKFASAAGITSYGGTADISGVANAVDESIYRRGAYWLGNGATTATYLLTGLTNGQQYTLRGHFYSPAGLIGGTMTVNVFNIDGGANSGVSVPSGAGRVADVTFTASGTTAVINFATTNSEKYIAGFQLYKVITPISISSITRPTTSIKQGDSFSPTANFAGGSGTKNISWKVDGVSVANGSGTSGATTATPIIAASYFNSPGAHTLRCDVTDDSGSAYLEVEVWTGTVSGLFTTGNATEDYTHNIANAVTTIVGGGSGSVSDPNATTSRFTKPTTGSGSTNIKVTNASNTNRYVTFTVNWYAVIDAAMTAPTSINTGSNLTITDASTGGSGTRTREFKFNGVVVSPSSSSGSDFTFNSLGAGAYTVRMTVTDDTGTDYVEQVVNVRSISGPAYVMQGRDAAFMTDVPSPVWSITSNTTPPCSIDASTGVLTGAVSGTGTITIKATKSGDSTVYATKTVNLIQVITAAFNYSPVVIIGDDATFTNTSSGGVGTRHYEWFLDGDDTPYATTTNLTLENPSIGNHEITLRTYDDDGNEDFETHSFTVSNIELTSEYSPNTGLEAPVTIQFTDTTAVTPTEPEWDFGDYMVSYELNPKHKYLAPGTYKVWRKALVNGVVATEEYEIVIGGEPSEPLETGIDFDEIEIPRDYLDGAKGGPTFLTSILGNPIGRQQRNISRYDFLNVFELEFNHNIEEFYEFYEFFITRWGGAIGFRCFDPLDHDFDNELVATVTNGNAVYRLIKTYEKAGRKLQRRIVKPNTDLVFKLNNVVVNPSTYVINHSTGEISFNSPGSLTTGQKLTVSGTFCIPAVFQVDNFDPTHYATFAELTIRIVELLPAALGIYD